jgi:ubiquitin-like 1-activating enzyme E1 B
MFVLADLTPPNPKCYVCAAKPEVVLKVNTSLVTVKELRDDILIKALNMVDPDVMLDGKGLIVISSEEGETEENNDKKLCDLFIVDGCILKVDDFFQNYELTVTVLHKDTAHDEPLFEVIADPDSLKAKEEPAAPAEQSADVEMKTAEGANGKAATVVEDDDDDLCILEDDEEVVEAPKNGNGSCAENKQEKRKLQEDEGPSSKKAKTVAPAVAEDDDDLICIDDD